MVPRAHRGSRPEQPARHRHPALPRGADTGRRAAHRRRVGGRRRASSWCRGRRAETSRSRCRRCGPMSPCWSRATPTSPCWRGWCRSARARCGSNRAGTRNSVSPTAWTPPSSNGPSRDSGAKALWVLHPTYYGTTGDIGALAELCRRHDAKLLVDGAHSPHFAFHPDLPAPGETSGAAATVQSVHKILSGLSQAAVLHVDTAVLDPATVRRALQLIQTTSPHFAIMASIDLARRQMMLDGRALLDETLDRARRTADRLAAIGGVRVLRPEHLAGAGTGLHQLDETKLLDRHQRPGRRCARDRRPAQPRARRAARVERHRTRAVHHHDRQHRRRHGPSGRGFRPRWPTTSGARPTDAGGPR